MRLLPLAAAMLLTAVTQACGDRERTDVVTTADSAMQGAAQEATGTVEGPREFGFENRQDFTQSIRDQLAETDRQIEELTAQAKSEGGAVSDRALTDIRAARRAVDKNLARVDAATAENWEEIRRGVDEAVEHLDEAVEMAQPK